MAKLPKMKLPTFRKLRKEVPVTQGITINQEWVDENRELVEKYADFFTIYPDHFLDLIQPKDSFFELYFYQRVLLRSFSRYALNYCVAPRAFAKSFLALLALYLKCMFLPGVKVFLCAPGKEQGAKIAKEKIEDIWKFFPYLKKEVMPGGNMRDDKVRIVFKNGSILDIVYAGDSERGGRRNAGIIDEVRSRFAYYKSF